MAWYWSDDVARAALEAGIVTEPQVADWLARPVAVADDAGIELTDVARRMLGLDVEAAGAA